MCFDNGGPPMSASSESWYAVMYSRRCLSSVALSGAIEVGKSANAAAIANRHHSLGASRGEELGRRAACRLLLRKMR